MKESLPLIIQRYGNIYPYSTTQFDHVYHCTDQQYLNLSNTSNNTLQINPRDDQVFNFEIFTFYVGIF